MAIVILILTFLLFKNAVSYGDLCEDPETSIKYALGEKISQDDTRKCYLCECKITGKWDCYNHVCSDMNCMVPKYGERGCCRHLNCPGIFILI